MKLSDVLKLIDKLAKENGLAEPYIVGGIPRDRAFGKPSSIKDIDITTGNDDSLTLAMAFAKQWPKAHFQVFDDGHSSVQFSNIQVDFSNNYQIPNITEELKKQGIDEASDIQKEMFSRDFTINTLLQPLDLTLKPIDITGKAIDDIENGILRTPINAYLTIGYDPRRILRALKLAMKFNLTIMPSLKDAIIKYRGNLQTVPMNQVKKQVNQMINIDSKKAIEMLAEYKLLPIIPLSRLLTKEITKKRMVQQLLED
jgi:tRNA nucleotidyltransferase/poly(A) polymerase